MTRRLGLLPIIGLCSLSGCIEASNDETTGPTTTAAVALQATELVCTASGYDFALGDDPIYDEDLVFPLDPTSGTGDVQTLEFGGYEAQVVYQLLNGQSEVYVYLMRIGDQLVHASVNEMRRAKIKPGSSLVIGGLDPLPDSGITTSLTIDCRGR